MRMCQVRKVKLSNECEVEKTWDQLTSTIKNMSFAPRELPGRSVQFPPIPVPLMKHNWRWFLNFIDSFFTLGKDSQIPSAYALVITK